MIFLSYSSYGGYTGGNEFIPSRAHINERMASTKPEVSVSFSGHLKENLDVFRGIPRIGSWEKYVGEKLGKLRLRKHYFWGVDGVVTTFSLLNSSTKPHRNSPSDAIGQCDEDAAKHLDWWF